MNKKIMIIVLFGMMFSLSLIPTLSMVGTEHYDDAVNDYVMFTINDLFIQILVICLCTGIIGIYIYLSEVKEAIKSKKTNYQKY